MEYKKWSFDLAGKEIVIETGKYCALANGSCVLSCQDTVLLVTATMSNYPRENIDFFPLSVDFVERMYAVGRMPGGFKRREGRASDKSAIISRLIDRPLRPLFPKGFFNDVSIVVTPLSIDPEIAPEPLSMLASSVALILSDIPFEEPTGSVCVGYVNGEFVLNPTVSEMDKSDLHLLVAGTEDRILMVEAGANELSEDIILNAIEFGQKYIKQLVKFQKEIKKEVGAHVNDKIEYRIPSDELKSEIESFAGEKIKKLFEIFDKVDRSSQEGLLDKEIIEYFSEKYPKMTAEIAGTIYALKKAVVRNKILGQGTRPDGRALDEIRPITCDVGVLPRVHGSGVFNRGLTQVMTILTLSNLKDVQELDGIDNEKKKRYMHHYNMPPYSTGEARSMRGPGRREIGHGALSERALIPVLPSEDEFPYAIRTVSEVLTSNGSTSQASICASSLALMDGGVPITAPVAGIAMGLITVENSSDYKILTDIQGIEDFYGDMDFKVAGSHRGITAIQMDLKLKGIELGILADAIEKGKKAREFILTKMNSVMDKPRTSISQHAPIIVGFRINPQKIGEVIGGGGKTINKIIEMTGVSIDIEDDGRVSVCGFDMEKVQEAKKIIEEIIEEVVVGKTYTGIVVKTMNFGAFVKILNDEEGLIHISKLSDKMVQNVEEVVRVGDKVEVEVLNIDAKGRVNLKLNKILLN